MALPLLKLGSRGTWVRVLQQKLAARGHKPGPADGIFGAGTLKAVRGFQKTRKLGVDGIVGPRTWAAVGIHPTKTPTGTAGTGSGRHLAAIAHKVVTGGYGHPKPRYRFGAEQSTADLRNPASWRNLDCSEFTQGLATVELGGRGWVDGADNQWRTCRKITVTQAIRTPGALLFIFGASSRQMEPFVYHVAVSLGDGRTAELRSTALGAGVWGAASSRFNRAGLIPGVRY